MNHRMATLHALKSYTADTTEIIDVNVRDPISQLIIELRVGNTLDEMQAHPIACLTKIELVDGSDVLFSLSGYEAEALDWYSSKGINRCNWNYWLGGTSTRFIVVNFGRHLWDEVLALDPAQFSNLQLKLSLDINAGGNTATSNSLQVFAALFDEKVITPVGFLMSKEIKNYPLTSGGHEYTDLPTDYAYRKLLFRSLLAGTEANQTIANFKLSEDVDKRVIVDAHPDDILRSMVENSPPVKESFICTVTNASNQYKYIMPTTRVTAFATEWISTPGTGQISCYDGDGGRLKIRSATTFGNTMVRVQGWLPHAVWEIPFGKQDVIDDWYDVSGVGSLVADITAGAVTHNAQLFLQQLRRY